MAFTSTTIVKGRLAALLKKAVADLPTYWDDIVSDALDEGYQSIVSALARRGYSLTQIQAWDRGAGFEKDIALWWCCVKGAGLGAPDDHVVQHLDRRLELDTVTVTISGVEVVPAGTGQVGFGYMDDSLSTFKRQVTSADGEVDETSW